MVTFSLFPVQRVLANVLFVVCFIYLEGAINLYLSICVQMQCLVIQIFCLGGGVSCMQ
jgi:hypothetical protein